MKSFAGIRNLKSIAAVLLLVIFCWHLGSVHLFPHSHNVDGVKISHSHPFSGTRDNPGHGHSQAQLDTIAWLSVLVFLLGVACVLSLLAPRGIANHVHLPAAGVQAKYYDPYNKRGPPRV